MRPEQEQEAVAAPYRLKDEAQAVLPDPRTGVTKLTGVVKSQSRCLRCHPRCREEGMGVDIKVGD